MLIIGITGGTASGKTSLVQQITKVFSASEIGVIAQDSYYKTIDNLDYEERAKTNFDHPDAIDFDLLIAHLKELKAGNTIQQPVYSFVTHNRTEDFVLTSPPKVMLVEGILTLSNPELRDLFDIKIFIDADADERLIRRLKRDISERGRDLDEVVHRYQTTLKPMHDQFIEPTKAFADFVIANNKHNNTAIDILHRLIKQQLL